MFAFGENESSTDTVRNIRAQIGVLLGGEVNATQHQMQAIINFETKLAEITTPQDERRDEEKLYNLMSIGQLQKLAPFVSIRI